MAASRVALAGLLDLETGSRPRQQGGAKSVHVDANTRADFACARLPVSQKYRHRPVGLTGHDPRRKLDSASLITELDDVFILDSQPPRKARSEERGVAPGELGQGLGKFLQPAVVGPPAIADGRVGPEKDLEAFRTTICRPRGNGDFIWRPVKPPSACWPYRRSSRPREPFAMPTQSRRADPAAASNPG